MPEWCENNLEITGSNQEIEQIEALLLNEKGLLDFNVLIPMPEELNGAYMYTFEGGIKINTTYENRLSKLNPTAFIGQLVKLHTATKNPAYLIENIATLFDVSSIFKADEAIEQSIINAMDDWLSIEDADKQQYSDPRINSFVVAILKAMQEHTKAFCLESYGYTESDNWSMANWGVKCNVFADPATRLNMDGSSVYDFQTAWGPATQWLDTVIDKISEMKDNNAQVCLKYAEQSAWLGGKVGINANGFTYDHVFSDEEICEFLNIDPDDIHGEEDTTAELEDAHSSTDSPW